jgi:hypothetical protein
MPVFEQHSVPQATGTLTAQPDGDGQTGNGGVHMVAKEFLKAFAETTDDFTWEYVERDRIRGFLKSGDIGRAFDPIEAMLFSGRQRERHAVDTIESLGLSTVDREAIVDAANGNIWKTEEGQPVLDGYAAWFREGLCLAAGMELEELPSCAPREDQIQTLVPAMHVSATGLNSRTRPQTI